MTITPKTTEDLLEEIETLKERNENLDFEVAILEDELDEATVFTPDNDRLAPLELVPICASTTLDDLDWRAKAVAGGWHSDAETREHIMAIARAVPRLTAELRRLGCR
jgi:ribosomal protein S9